MARTFQACPSTGLPSGSGSASRIRPPSSPAPREVAFGPLALGLPAREALGRARSTLESLAIGDLAERDPLRLSGGQGQLVVIASLLAMRPRHLVLDEPTAQLDPHGTGLVGDALRRLAGTGTALLVAEHRTGLLAGLCDRIVVLEGGAIVAEGPAREVLGDERLVGWGVRPPEDVAIERALTPGGVVE
jgi:energy-coupling factor transporter ATP-binding protein EcfA2